ncbi:hypothetical protein CVT24_003131 [Panaeolus cyanescens]|uniref:Uncharacterized protein n=1 Tax=Panaeolus cyanescens TaxID=181874 RepID=A0A409YXW2_9AGAR|nr:hypothetical protein CVT24_003131 [Panaeolus cyanescens]
MEISVVMMLVLLGGFFMAMGAISVFRDVYWRHRARNRAPVANRRTRRSASIENGDNPQIFVLDLPITHEHVYPPLPHPNARENRVHLPNNRASSNNGRERGERRVDVPITRVDDHHNDFLEDRRV